MSGVVGDWLGKLAALPAGATVYPLDAFDEETTSLMREMARRQWISLETCSHQHTIQLLPRGYEMAATHSVGNDR